MKVKLKVNLKVALDHIVDMGTVFSDEDGAFPDYVSENLEDARIIEKLLETGGVARAFVEPAVAGKNSKNARALAAAAATPVTEAAPVNTPSAAPAVKTLLVRRKEN